MPPRSTSCWASVPATVSLACCPSARLVPGGVFRAYPPLPNLQLTHCCVLFFVRQKIWCTHPLRDSYKKRSRNGHPAFLSTYVDCGPRGAAGLLAAGERRILAWQPLSYVSYVALDVATARTLIEAAEAFLRRVDLQLMVFFHPRRAENRTFRPPVTQNKKTF